MSEDKLKELSLDDLLVLLSATERNLAIAKQYNQGPNIIQHNKNQLQKLKKAITNKQGNTLASE